MSFLRRTRLVIIVVAAVGIAVSAYLIWVHYSGSLALCVGVGGCEAVQASRYAEIGPLPIAALGEEGCVIASAASQAGSASAPLRTTSTCTASISRRQYAGDALAGRARRLFRRDRALPRRRVDR